MDTTTEYILVRSDGHSGALRGLQHPEQLIELDGRLMPLNQTSWQKTIWDDVYVDGLKYFAEIVGDAPLTVLDGGDLVQGNYHLDDVVSPILKTQFEIGMKTFEPIYKTFPGAYQTVLLIGSRAHALDEEGTVETVMRDRLRAGGHYCEVYGHGALSIAGAIIDASHIGPNPGKGTNRGNAILNYLKGAMWDELMLLGKIPPDLYLRFHYHDWTPAKTWSLQYQGETITSQALVCPPLSSMNGYGRGATKSVPYVHVGMMLIRVRPDGLDVIPWVRVYDVRQYSEPGRGTVAFHYGGTPRPGRRVNKS